MKLFDRNSKSKKKKQSEHEAAVIQTAGRSIYRPFGRLSAYSPGSGANYALYTALRESVPVIDAALEKLVRLIGSFEVVCESKETTARVNDFLENVKAGGQSGGINTFLSSYMNQLLTYGTAVGEIALTGNGRDIYSLVNVPLGNVQLAFDENMVDILVYPAAGSADSEPFPFQQLILFSALNPEPGKPIGVSLLHGLPFVSEILMKIYNTIGVNWERVGNVRFAVTYKPSGDGDRALSRSRAQQIADEWSKAMRDKENVSDFVSVGDVSIKVIGADNQVLDSEVPVREMLEQIVAKLSIPPFLLGLSWSTTERMSSQQADILTSELEYYRRILDGVTCRIVELWLQLHGCDEKFEIKWNYINLQDELELSQARLYNAQAAQIEQNLAAITE